jgi:chromosomal replication initiator protein
MEKRDALSIWEKVLHNLKSELRPNIFDSFIKPLVPLSIDKNTLILQVDEDFKKNILEARYIVLISNTLKYTTDGEYYKVEFILQSDASLYINSPINQVDKPSYTPNLIDRYTFDTFVVGSSNHFAYAASLAVSETPAKKYNPLFIYGGVGLGKTHLMHAIGNYIHKRKPKMKILYISSEQFMNEFIYALQKKTNISFRNKYRTVDVLLIDDIQFIGGGESTQEEFFHTFCALQADNKQIVISSDKPPKEIPRLEERLRSRFEQGLICDIQPPDFETRVAILRRKSERENIQIDKEVIDFIASNIQSNIRELEGVLLKVKAISELTQQAITLDLVKNEIKDITSINNKKITVDSIKTVVSSYFNVSVEDLSSKQRTKLVAYPRQVAMYLTRILTDHSTKQIGAEFGNRDHTTVLYACEKIKDDAAKNHILKNDIEKIIKEIRTFQH